MSSALSTYNTLLCIALHTGLVAGLLLKELKPDFAGEYLPETTAIPYQKTWLILWYDLLTLRTSASQIFEKLCPFGNALVKPILLLKWSTWTPAS